MMKLNKPEQPFKLYTSISLKKYVHFLLHKSLSTFIGNRLIHGLSFTLIDSAMRAQFVRQIGQEGQDRQDGQDGHLNLTFQETSVGQFLQFLRCFFLAIAKHFVNLRKQYIDEKAWITSFIFLLCHMSHGIT